MKKSPLDFTTSSSTFFAKQTPPAQEAKPRVEGEIADDGKTFVWSGKIKPDSNAKDAGGKSL